jgi:prepilin-type N-terminal cleavage/methylation domain-containing protein/prepilin-type processing-associated H-X9-DG protein
LRWRFFYGPNKVGNNLIPWIMKTKRAFTLVELLVVVAIIAILALLVSVAAGSFQKKAQKAQSISNLKQLASGLLDYTGSHDGEFPKLGLSQPAWGAPEENQREDWYHAIPKAAGGRGLGEFEKPVDFYQKKNLLFFPVAKYPKQKLTRPYFSVAINASLYGKSDARKEPDKLPTLRMSNLQLPVSTVIFVEVGLPDEDLLPGQSEAEYSGTAHGGPQSIVARYNQIESKEIEDKRSATTIMVFADGHVEELPAKDVLDISGAAFNPQLPQYGGQGKVCWTMDPEATP